MVNKSLRAAATGFLVAAMLGIAVPASAQRVTSSARFLASSGLHQLWTVPDGVSSVEVTVTGASGGEGGLDCGRGCNRTPSSQVGRVRATLQVTAGDLVDLYPGRVGSPGRDNGGCSGLGGLGGASDFGLAGGRGGDAGCVGASGGGGGGGAGSAVVAGSQIVIAGGGGGGGGNRNNSTEAWQFGQDEGGRLASRAGGDGVNPRDVRGTGVDGGGGGGGGGGWSGGAGGTEATCCGEFGAYGGVRGSNGWQDVEATEQLVASVGDGYVDVVWVSTVPSIPSAPRQPEVEATSANSGHLSWDAPVDIGDAGILFYAIEGKEEGRNEWTSIRLVDGSFESAQLPDLPCGVRVNLRVRAVNVAGTSEPSPAVTWNSPPSAFMICPAYPAVAPIGATVALRVAGAAPPEGMVGTGFVEYVMSGKKTSVPVNSDGVATLTLAAGARGRTSVTVNARYLRVSDGKFQTYRASSYVWTPSFSIPKVAVIGQNLRISGSYVAPGARLTLTTVDGSATAYADGKGSVTFAQPLVTRGNQLVKVTYGSTVLAAATVKVGGKPSTW